MSATELISQGKRSSVCGEIAQAVECFQKACELLATEHGDLDEHLAEPNFLYGSALLELARMEATVIGNALDGVPEDDSDSDSQEKGADEEELNEDQREDISNQVIDAMCEKSPKPTDEEKSESVDSKEQPSEEAGKPTEESGDEEEEEEGEENNEDADDPEGVEDPENQKDAAEENDTDSDDVTNLQLAWEVIEVAKQIYTRKDDKLKVADCLEKLGEISREKEDNEQAIADLSECLSLRSSLLNKNDREIAETHFQLGTTYAAAGDLDKASKAFKEAITVLRAFLDQVQAEVTRLENTDNPEKEVLERQRFTLKEIETLIPDLERRLNEVDEDRMAAQFQPGTSGFSTSNNGDALSTKEPADDISHLVRKKRTVETDGTEVCGSTDSAIKSMTPESKKIKLSENGTDKPTINGNHVNGTKEVTVE